MIIACADLLEAEGRCLRRSILRLGVAILCLGGAALLLLGGSGLLLWAAYQLLSQSLGPLAAAVASAVAMIVLGGILAWLSVRLTR